MIDIKELHFIEYYFSSGNFSSIHLIKYNGELYCFKEFEQIYPEDILNNIENLTYMNFDKFYLAPKYLITKNGKIIGYLSHFKKNTHHINFNTLSSDKKIIVLKNAKNTILKLHNKYQLIHGDLNISNILYDNNYNTYLLDFDSALKFNQPPNSLLSFSGVVTYYMNYFNYDYITNSVLCKCCDNRATRIRCCRIC